MSTKPPTPSWLCEFQRRFGGVITTPLDRQTGRLRARTEAYDPHTVEYAANRRTADALAGLAVYNRQYWFRLFEVLQTAFPLTTRLLGHWTFNAVAEQFLVRVPPRSWDIDRVPDKFAAFATDQFVSFINPQLHRSPDDLGEALVEAVRIDAEWRRIFSEQTLRCYKPTPADQTRLLQARLLLSPALALVHENWPLLALRKRLATIEGEAPVALPERWVCEHWYALRSLPKGIVQIELDPLEAKLIRLLTEHTIENALGILENECPEELRETLPTRTQNWLSRSVQLGFWLSAEFRES